MAPFLGRHQESSGHVVFFFFNESLTLGFGAAGSPGLGGGDVGLARVDKRSSLRLPSSVLPYKILPGAAAPGFRL